MDDLLDQIGRTDAVIATRYHNVVGALMMARPTVSIGYAEKNKEVMDDVGLGTYCHHVENFSSECVLRDLDRVLEQWSAHLPLVERRTSEYVRLVEEEFESVIGSGRDGLSRRAHAREALT